MRRRLQRGFVPPVVQERSTEGHTKKEVGVEEVDLISSAFGDARLGRHAGRSAGYAEDEQEGESAELSQDSSATQEGDNSIQCANDQLTGNTGNAQTLNQGLQYASEGSVSPSGNAEITLTPNEDVQDVFTCDAQVNQAASAAS